MIKRIFLIGEAASGKDTIRAILNKDALLSYDVSYTTRPPRPNEVDGVDYHFVTEEKFLSMEWHEKYKHRNGFWYGTSLDSWNNNVMFIKTPDVLNQFSKTDLEETYIVYITAPEEVRRDRLSKRISNAEDAEERLATDKLQFQNFKDYDLKIVDFNIEKTSLLLQTITDGILSAISAAIN